MTISKKKTSFTFSDLFNMREQRQDAPAPILLVGMAEFCYLAHVILLSFSGSKVCSRWLNYVEVVNINLRFCQKNIYFLSSSIFFHVYTLKTLSDSIVLIITGKRWCTRQELLLQNLSHDTPIPDFPDFSSISSCLFSSSVYSP